MNSGSGPGPSLTFTEDIIASHRHYNRTCAHVQSCVLRKCGCNVLNQLSPLGLVRSFRSACVLVCPTCTVRDTCATLCQKVLLQGSSLPNSPPSYLVGINVFPCWSFWGYRFY